MCKIFDSIPNIPIFFNYGDIDTKFSLSLVMTNLRREIYEASKVEVVPRVVKWADLIIVGLHINNQTRPHVV
jgi:hypothetical protein